MAADYDVIIIGGGITGLVSAYTCQQLGFRSLTLEKSDQLGGGNLTFKNNAGNIFDNGYHTLDFNRSPLTTHFFQKMLDNEVHKIELERGIVLKDNLLEYDAPLEAWPDELVRLFDKKEFYDDLGASPSLEDLAGVYGKEFAELIYDDVLLSYPSKKWGIEQGGRALDQIAYVYPWFCPKAKRVASREGESSRYHLDMREEAQYVLYPNSGGFEQFILSIGEKVVGAGGEIEKNCKDLELISSSSGNEVNAVSVNGTTYSAPLIFWCAPIALLFKQLKVKLPNVGVPQSVVFGNFTFDGELPPNFHEILVGSSKHKINRISFPGKIRSERNNLLQVEYYFPKGSIELAAEDWKGLWFDSLESLGIVEAQQCVEFQFVETIRGFATIKSFDDVSEELIKLLKSLDTSLQCPFPVVGPENINRIVPGTITNVTKLLNNERVSYANI